MSDARPGWPTIRRVLAWAFLALVAALLVRQGRRIDWSEVLEVLRGYRPGTLLAAAGLAAASHLLYLTFDQLGRRYTGHALPRSRVAAVAFVSYAFNLNLGSLIGGIGLRYRLYSRLGLETDVIARVVGLSITSNWIGYLLLAGIVFATRAVPVPPTWRLGTGALQWIGFALLAVVATYLWACAFSRRRTVGTRRHAIHLPSIRMAAIQLSVSAINWLAIAALLHLLLGRDLPYATVLGVFLVSAVAAVLTHVPAGLGVLELVFVTMLGHRIGQGEIIAALLAYRALYYLAPLALALVLYLRLEADARSSAAALRV